MKANRQAQVYHAVVCGCNNRNGITSNIIENGETTLDGFMLFNFHPQELSKCNEKCMKAEYALRKLIRLHQRLKEIN